MSSVLIKALSFFAFAVALTLAAAIVLFQADSAYSRSFSDEDAIRLTFDSVTATSRRRPLVDLHLYVFSSDDAVADVHEDLLILLDQLTSLSGQRFEQIEISNAKSAHVGVYAEPYAGAAQYEAWRKSSADFTEIVNLDGRGVESSRLFAVIESLAQVANSMVAQMPEASQVELDLYEHHKNMRACDVFPKYDIWRGNRATSRFAFEGVAGDREGKLSCALKAFLAASGLKGVKRFSADSLLTVSGTMGERNVTLSPLVQCALEALYHRDLDRDGTPARTSVHQMQDLLENGDVCR